MSSPTFTCPSCALTLSRGPGRPPKACPACTPDGDNRARQLARLRKRCPADADRVEAMIAVRRELEGQPLEARLAIAPLLLAVGLWLVTVPRAAVELMGLCDLVDAPDGALVGALIEARHRYGSLIAARPGLFGGRLHAALVGLALRGEAGLAADLVIEAMNRAAMRATALEGAPSNAPSPS